MILNYIDIGKGEPIVLLHGMAGSTRSWNKLMPYIEPGHRIITMDLLGFGHSPKPDASYDYDNHIQSILETLDYLNIHQQITLVGYSMGGLLSLKLAAEYPNQVNKLVLIAMPIYKNAVQAHQALTGKSKLKQLAYYGVSSQILCNIWCRGLRPISSRLAPFYLRSLTSEAAKDSVLHTWQSYARSLHNIIENQNVQSDLLEFKKPTLIICGDRDQSQQLEKLVGFNLRLIIMNGTHQLINEQPQEIATLILN